MKYKWLESIILALVFVSALPMSSAVGTVFRNVSSTDGLSDLMVSTFYKDSRGFLWLGTATSVEWFDGIRLHNYPYPPLSDNTERLKWVNIITETHNHDILVGSDNGLWQPKENELVSVMPDIIKGRAVHGIIAAKDGTLYIGSSKGLIVNKGKKVEEILLDKNSISPANDIKCMERDEKGNIWIATRQGLYSFNTTLRKTTFHPNNLLKNESDITYRCMTHQDGILYLGTMTDGIYTFDTANNRFSRCVNIGSKPVMALGFHGKDVLYAGTDGNGIMIISTKHNKIIQKINYDTQTPGGIRSNSVYSLLIDRDGLLWAGLYQYGFDYTVFRNKTFSVWSTPYFSSEGIPIRAIYSQKGMKVIGSLDGIYYIDEKAQRVTRFRSPEIRSEMTTCIYPYQGKILIGTYEGGMYVLDPNKVEISDFDHTKIVPFVKGSIFHITSDKNGDLWISSTDGIFRYRNGSIINHFTPDNSPLPGRHVYMMFFDHMGKGWACTDKGLCLWDATTEKMRTDLFPKGFINQEKVGMMYEDSDHRLYFILHTGIIYEADVSMDNCHILTSNKWLSEGKAKFVIEDHDKWLWIGTSNGLYHYDKKEKVVLYNMAEGIPGPIFMNCQPITNYDGTLFFGNSKGLITLKSDWRKSISSNRYKMMVTQFMINGTEPRLPNPMEQGTYTIKLKSSENNVTVCFSDFSYIDPDYTVYEYQLNNDGKWHKLMGKSEIALYNLTVGTHTLRIRHISGNDSELNVTIRVSPSINWAVITILCLILIGAGGTVAYRRTLVNKQKNTNKPSTNNEIREKYKTYTLTEKRCQELVEELEKVMKEQSLYNNPNLKIADLAATIGMQSHTLSYVFNQYLKKSYYDYLNDYRISEFKRRIQKGEHIHYTLEALMKQCGFSSRTTFFRSFKKANGMTPNEYIKEWERKSK